MAPELFSFDFSLPTGGLPIVKGIKTYTVCRANREHPEKAEGSGILLMGHPKPDHASNPPPTSTPLKPLDYRRGFFVVGQLLGRLGNKQVPEYFRSH